jgi:hypothetical protein
MAFELVAYDLLKTSILDSLKSLILNYSESRTLEEARLKDFTHLLPEERHTQSDYLLKIIELVDLNLKDDDPRIKAKVLNAAAYYICAKIKKVYDKSLFANVGLTSVDGSVLYVSLTSALQLTQEHHPSLSDERTLFETLLDFLRSQVYVGSNPAKGYLEPQPFEEVFNYKVEDDIKDLVKRIAKVDRLLVKESQKLHEKAQRPVTTAGMFSLFAATSESKSLAAAPKDSPVINKLELK